MLSFLAKCWATFKAALISVLPTSPFQGFISYLSSVPYLGYINWFIPMGTIISITVTWTTAIGLYYLYSIVMRWIKVIA